MSTYGRELLETVGTGIQVAAEGAPLAKTGGVSVSWADVPAATVDATYESDVAVLTGEKFMRYGTILELIEGGTSDGLYAPHGVSPAGGGTLSTDRGKCFILNENVFETDYKSDHPAVIEGGRMYQSRLQVVGYTGAAPDGFTLLAAATFEATFPTATFVIEASS